VELRLISLSFKNRAVLIQQPAAPLQRLPSAARFKAACFIVSVD
jgi:hypothetical protein